MHLPTTGLATSGPAKWDTRTRAFWGLFEGLSLCWASPFLFFSLMVSFDWHASCYGRLQNVKLPARSVWCCSRCSSSTVSPTRKNNFWWKQGAAAPHQIQWCALQTTDTTTGHSQGKKANILSSRNKMGYSMFEIRVFVALRMGKSREGANLGN